MEENAVVISQSMLYLYSTVLAFNSGLALYLLQDYVKFRFNLSKEYMTKTECAKQHLSDEKSDKEKNRYLEEKFKNINEKLDTIMFKLED